MKTSTAQPVGLLPAAGLATRLGISTAKELLVHDGRPVIEWSVEMLRAAGTTRVVIVIRTGKEVVVEHLRKAFPSMHFDVVYQHGPIGNLLNALQAAVPALGSDHVRFCLPDTRVEPNPFLARRERYEADLSLHCFSAGGEDWRNFGVVGEREHKVVDKPRAFVGRTCWGVLEWSPTFSARLARATDLTELINEVGFEYHQTIQSYVDIGVDRAAAGLELQVG